MSETQTSAVDTVIIGGGVAALWTANALKASGQSVVVLTNSPLGEGQSLAAQGVIHGGMKYAVAGKLTDSSEALADMPSRWLAALAGEGPVDLSGAELLSDHQILWSLPNVVSRVAGFFGSKAVRGRSDRISREEYPEVFDANQYRGSLFRIEEPVVDPVSTIREMACGVSDETWQVDWGKNTKLESDGEGISSIRIQNEDGREVALEANRYLLAAGAGNGAILDQLGMHQPVMQRRPLHQLIIRKPELPAFYSVCVGTTPKPPVVVTTHVDSQGRTLWYVGGDIAEQAGVDRSEAEQVEFGKKRFAEYLPWIDLSVAEWFTHRVDRAEPLTGTSDRPPGAYCEEIGNVIVAWPTKLALAPELADQVLKKTTASERLENISLPMPRPTIGKAPWDLD